MAAGATSGTRSRHAKILGQVDQMLDMIRDAEALERRNDDVSIWNVGQQIEHTLRVQRNVVTAIERILAGGGDPTDQPNPGGRVMLFLGWIPRGRGKAPDAVLPRDVSPERLQDDLGRERQRCAELDLERVENAEGSVKHAVFGPLTAKRWLRFIEIHNHHHLKIIREIRQSS